MLYINLAQPKIGPTKKTTAASAKIVAAVVPTPAHESLASFIGALAIAVAALTVTIHTAHAGDRAKVIDFEEATIEGMNRRPYDSLQALNEKDRNKRRAHLYRRRASFHSEVMESLRERAWEYATE